MKRVILANRRDNYFGELSAFEYGDDIVKTLGVGATISKRKNKANEPGGLIYEASKLGIKYIQLLEALEGMCADGRAREHETEEDSWYEIINTKRHPARTLFYDEVRDPDSIWKTKVTSSEEFDVLPEGYEFIAERNDGYARYRRFNPETKKYEWVAQKKSGDSPFFSITYDEATGCVPIDRYDSVADKWSKNLGKLILPKS